MKLSNIKTGMLIELAKEPETWVVIGDRIISIKTGDGGTFGNYISLYSYNEDLTNKHYHDLDIVKVMLPVEHDPFATTHNAETIWEREKDAHLD